MIKNTESRSGGGHPSPAVLAAGIVLLLASSPGHAAIVYFGNENIAIPNTYTGVSVDLEDGDYANDLAGIDGGDANFFFGGALVGNDADQLVTVPSWQPVRRGSGVLDPIAKLAAGTQVDENSTYGISATGYGVSGDPNPHIGIAAGEFSDGGTGYLGFSLVIDDPEGPGTLTAYGWMQVRLQDRNGVGEILDWAYEDTGAPILVGVPEPTTTVLLGGLAVIGLLRRRRI